MRLPQATKRFGFLPGAQPLRLRPAVAIGPVRRIARNAGRLLACEAGFGLLARWVSPQPQRLEGVCARGGQSGCAPTQSSAWGFPVGFLPSKSGIAVSDPHAYGWITPISRSIMIPPALARPPAVDWQRRRLLARPRAYATPPANHATAPSVTPLHRPAG